MTDQLSPETVMACAILSARSANEPVLIEKISGLFAKLRQEKIEDVGRVALRRVPHGLYSEDVEAFFGRLLAGGFAQARSPLEVNDKGIELCQELIDEESESHAKQLEKVAMVLGFDLSKLKNPRQRQMPA
jgi:hypothetical protein